MINNLNLYNVNNFKTPAMQGEINIDKDKIKSNANDNPIGKRLDSAENSPLTPAMMIPIWIGIGKLMDKFNLNCRGKYEDSIPGKVSAWGDNFTQKHLKKNKTAIKFSKVVKTTKNFVQTKVIDKSKILSAFFKTPSKPTNKLVLTQGKGIISQYTNDYTTVVDKFLEQKAPKKLIDAVALRTGKTQDEIKKLYEVKNLKKVGLTPTQYDVIKKDAAEHVDDIINACKKADKNLVVRMGNKKIGILGRDVHFSEFVNKLTGAKGMANPMAKSTLGKVLPKWMLAVTEGLTNGTAGGKLAMLMQAYIFADAATHSIKAEKGEKGKTFAERVVYDLSYFLTLPLVVTSLHAVGGLQYTGMSKKEVESYRKSLAAVNKRADAGKYTKAQYDAVTKALKNKLKGTSKGPLQWLAKKVGSVMTVGLETVKPYKSANQAGNALRNAKYYLKQGAGYPVRIIAGMMIIAPMFAKAGAKLSHLIFGKPKNSVLDEGKEDKKNKAEQIPQTQVNPQVAQGVNAQTVNANPFSAVQTKPRSYSYIPSSEGVKLPKEEEKTEVGRKYSYVPSASGVQIAQNSNDDKILAAIHKADLAEQQALKYL